jgi:hypothetical protein
MVRSLVVVEVGGESVVMAHCSGYSTSSRGAIEEAAECGSSCIFILPSGGGAS